MYIISWKNKFSGDSGYVRRVSKSNRCFYNANSKYNARLYSNLASAQTALDTLEKVGETKNNVFKIEPLR